LEANIEGQIFTLQQSFNAELAKHAEEHKEALEAQARSAAAAAGANADEIAKQAAAAAARSAANRQAAEANSKRLEEENAKNRARAALVDAELAKKTGKDFLTAQLANLSEKAKEVSTKLQVALKEEIEFTPCKAELTREGKKIVAKAAEVLIKNPDMKINVEGHTGCRCIAGGGQPKKGQGCKAMDLSKDRATAVVDHLRSLQCTNQFDSVSHGCIYRVGMAVKIFPARGQ